MFGAILLYTYAYSKDFQYLSETDKTFAYIESMQKAIDPGCEIRAEWEIGRITQAAKELAQRNCGADESCSENLFESVLNEVVGNTALPTRCESYISYSILDGLVKTVVESQGNNVDSQKPFPPYGTFLSHSFNASATGNPYNDDYIILFNYTLFTHINEFVKAVLYYGEIKNGARLPITAEQLAVSLARNTAYVVSKGKVERAGNLPFNYLPLELINETVRAIELFVVFHEYSHVILGHTAGNAMPLPSSPNVKVLNRAQKNELAADELGSRMLKEHLSKSPTASGLDSKSIHGDVMFLTMVEIFEEAMQIAGKKIQETTHPAATVRLSELTEESGDKSNREQFGYSFRENALSLWALAKVHYKTLVH
jgi:hypothetical protein